MKRKFSIIAVTALLCSCTPAVLTSSFLMRRPSSSGLDLVGKSLSVVFVGDSSDGAGQQKLAEGFTSALEEDYFEGEKAIEIMRLPRTENADYSSRDSLVSLIMASESDVVFLIDGKKTSEGYKLQLYSYDSMSKEDSVLVFAGTTSEKDPFKAGDKAASRFLPAWEQCRMSFYTIENYSAWEKAFIDVSSCNFRSAIDRWMSLLDTRSLERRAMAEYNLAAAFYILGDYDLSRKWLSASDEDYKTGQSDALARRLSAAQGTYAVGR